MGRKKRARRKKLAQVLPELLDVYRYFWVDIRRKRSLIASSFAALLAGVVLRLLEPWPLKFVLDQVFGRGGEEAGTFRLPESWSPTTVVLSVALAVVVIAAARAFTDYSSKVGFFKVGNYVVIRVRDRVYRHLQALPMSFHDRARHGDLIMRVTRDVSLLRDVAATAILPLLGSSMVLLGMASVMVWLNWRLAAVSLFVLPLYWLTTVRLGRQIRETARKQRQRESAMATIASESLGAIRAMKSMCLEDRFAAEFDRKNNQSQTDDLKASRLSLKLGRTVDILLAIATAGVLWLGATFVLGGSMSPGDLVVFLVYLKRSFKPAQEFAKYTARIAKATAAGERVIQILEIPIEGNGDKLGDELGNELGSEPGGEQDLRVNAGAIEFQNVVFGYDNQQLVLKDFSLRILPGQTVAITGRSGIGKSTLLGLLLRLYEPSSGRILIDGQDIRQCSLSSVRSSFGVVLQDPLLFAASVRDNIAISQPDAAESEIYRAAEMAEVDEFVMNLPDLYETVLGEHGDSLSRGQRQRIAIARAALADRSLLLLDEPITGLDEGNQAVVGQALFELGAARTTLIVTHNLSMASRADWVVYIDDGVVKEQGTHAELVRRAGQYARLHRQQTGEPMTLAVPES